MKLKPPANIWAGTTRRLKCRKMHSATGAKRSIAARREADGLGDADVERSDERRLHVVTEFEDVILGFAGLDWLGLRGSPDPQGLRPLLSGQKWEPTAPVRG